MPTERPPSRPRNGWLAALLLLTAPVGAAAEDLYFVVIFGSQRPVINRPRYTHTWATYVHLCGEGPDPRLYRMEGFTISWLPATLEVRPGRLQPEPGRLLTLRETVAWCEKNEMKTAQFGPYQIEPELYALSMRRHQELASGAKLYRAADLLNFRGDATNCIYAVLDYDGRDRGIRPLTLGFGYKASAFVSRRLSPFYVEPETTHPWLSEMLGVQSYPIVRSGLAARLLNE